MPLHNYYAVYVAKPGDLPDPATISKGLTQAATELMQLRASPLVPDFTGPVLFDAPASASVLAQMLAASLSGARPPLSMAGGVRRNHGADGRPQRMERPRGNARASPSVSLVDDPTMKDFQGQPAARAATRSTTKA